MWTNLSAISYLDFMTVEKSKFNNQIKHYQTHRSDLLICVQKRCLFNLCFTRHFWIRLINCMIKKKLNFLFILIKLKDSLISILFKACFTLISF